jgi:hypothetical protein
VDDDAEVEEAEPEEETKEEPSEDGEPEGETEVKEVADPPEEKPQVEVDVKAVAEQLASIFEVKLEPLNEMSANIGALAGAIKAMGERVQALEGGERIKKQVETPRFVLNLTNKASEAEETAIEDDDPLLKMKPAEAEKPAASGAANFFTGK